MSESDSDSDSDEEGDFTFERFNAKRIRPQGPGEVAEEDTGFDTILEGEEGDVVDELDEVDSVYETGYNQAIADIEEMGVVTVDQVRAFLA